MKKMLLICLAAMLVLAFTLPAAAKTTLSASGSFVNTGYYLTNIRAEATAGQAIAAAFQSMEANVTFKLQTAPNLWFNFSLNLMDRDWGYRDNTGFNRYWDDSRQQNPWAPPVVSDGNMGFNDFANFAEVTHANMTWLVYKGYVFVGRGMGGPGAKGAMQKSNVGASRDWKASDSAYDTISTAQTFGAWTVNGSAAKINEGDFRNGTADADYDSYTAGLKYSQKWGYAAGSFNWTRDRANWTTPYWYPDADAYTVGGDIYFKLGKAIHLSVEGSYKFGEFRNALGVMTMDIKGWDFCAQGEYIDGPYKIGAMFAITNGQDPAKQTTTANPVKTVGSDPGDEFHALYAAFGQYDGLLYSADNSTYIRPPLAANGSASQWGLTKTNSLAKGLQFYYGFADYKMMENLWVHAALGIMRWDEDPVDKNFGTEFDLGANYTIQKGFDLGVHFGYFIPGTWFNTQAAQGNHLHLDMELAMKF